jgi:beta-phosphoglucomutase-like phosphatase (HAD superfamily)
VAIVSSDSRDWIEGNLRDVGLSDGWAGIFCADGDRDRAKPAPWLYLEALAALGLNASQAVALEDSPNGVHAARRAGLFCVAVPNAVTEGMDLAHADLIVPSLADLPLEDLLQRAGGGGGGVPD